MKISGEIWFFSLPQDPPLATMDYVTNRIIDFIRGTFSTLIEQFTWIIGLLRVRLKIAMAKMLPWKHVHYRHEKELFCENQCALAPSFPSIEADVVLSQNNKHNISQI